MNGFFQDLRHGARALGKSPGFTAIAIVTLALGIGLNTAVFTVVNSVLLTPLDFPEPDRLVRLFTADPARGWRYMTISFPDFIDWREQSRSLSDLGIYTVEAANFTGGDRPERLAMVRASASLLPLLGFEARIGRTFSSREEQLGEERVVVLSDSFWRRRFAADPDIVGRSVLLDHAPFTVIGVLPPELERAWTRFDVWSPLPFDPAVHARGSREFRVFGRLGPGVTLTRARAEMENIAEGLATSYPASNREYTVNVVAYLDLLVDGTARAALAALAAAVGLVLLIACANVAHLLLVRATGRQREMAVRAALGAGRWRLVSQVMIECSLLALAGGALGYDLAVSSLDLLAAVLADTVGRVDEIAVDGRVLFFTLGLCLATTVLTALVPAARSASSDLAEGLGTASRTASVGKAGRLRRELLVAGQLALTVALLSCAALMIKSVLALRAVDPGFDARHLLTLNLSLPEGRYQDESQSAAFFERVMSRLRATPGVQSAAAITAMTFPLVGNSNAGASIEGYSSPDPDSRVLVGDAVVTPGYFETMAMPLLAGRDFTSHDGPDSRGVVIVNESMAKHFWPGGQPPGGEPPGGEPLGKRVKFGPVDSEVPWRTVVGVVGDVRQQGLDREARFETYCPFAQGPSPAMTIVVRTLGEPLAATAAVQEAIWQVDPDLALYGVRSMADVVDASLGGPSALARLLGVFAAVALVFTIAGLYGVMSYTVSLRTREIGIRMALGARSRDVVRLLARFAVAILLGAAGGGALTLLVGRSLEALLYGVSLRDPATWLAVAGLLITVALVAGYLPVRRAMAIDPIVVMKCE